MLYKNTFLAVSLAILASACGSGKSETQEENQSTEVIEKSAPPIENFEGKGPFDEIDGITFWEHPLVKDLISKALNSPELTQFITSKNNVFLPIESSHAQGTLGYGCEAHNCSGKNWNVLIGYQKATPERENYICYYEKGNTLASGLYNESGKIETVQDCGKYSNEETFDDPPATSVEFKADKMVKVFGSPDAFPELIVTSKNDTLNLTKIIINRGNCRLLYAFTFPSGNTRFPMSLQYGDQFKMRAECDPTEIEFVTDQGSAIYDW